MRDSRCLRAVPPAVFALCLASLALLGASCGRTTAQSDQAAAGAGRGGRGGGPGGGETGPIPVSTTRAVEKAVPLTVRTVGSGEAFSSVEVRPQVSGLLTSVLFAEGEDVAEGQVLFTIDPKPFQVALQQAEATLAKDQAQAGNAQAILNRNTELLKNGLVSQSDYDTVKTNAEALEAATKVDQAQVDNAKLQLAYTKISAPISGRTGALLVHQGSLVRTSDATPLVVINQITPIRAVFAVPGQYLAQIRTGQAEAPLLAEARPAGSAGLSVPGTLSFVDNAVDASTGTIKLKATFKNDDRRLWPGELVEVTLRLSLDPHAIVVPTTAVQNSQQGQFVYVVAGDRTVAMRPVKVSRTNGDDAVVSDGLKSGEEVVTDGQLRLTPGAKVTVKPAVGQKATQ